MATESFEYERRYSIRESDPSMPFLPWGCLPIAGLIATFALGLLPFAFLTIQQRVHDHTRLTLDGAGMQWVEIDHVDGQYVHLKGTQPTAGAGDKALALVRGAPATTWLPINAVPAVEVTGQFGAPTAAKAGPATPAEPAAPLTPSANPVDWVFKRNGTKLVLTGEVPSDAVRKRVVDHAKSVVDQVDDQLRVRGSAEPEGFTAMALRGIDTIAPCEMGSSAMHDRVFSLHCVIPEADAAPAKAAAEAAPTYGTLGTIEFLSSTAVTQCEDAMKALLTGKKIQFDSGSARIKPASAPLLDAIAAEVKACPGTVVIEGHTDSQGDDGLNKTLSQQRSEATLQALVERGVDGSHLKARGYGEERPVATNDTPAGMAENRRIEFHVSLED